MRLFIAIRFPEEALDAMTRAQDALKAQSLSGNFSRRENLHLTLSFLGEIAPSRVPELKKLLTRTARNTRPFSLAFDRLDCFPGRRGEALYYLAAASPPELTHLAARLNQSLRQAGFPQEDRAFVPHVTLVRRCVTRPDLAPDAPSPISVTAGSMELMLSEQRDGVRTYTPLFSAKFSSANR